MKVGCSDEGGGDAFMLRIAPVWFWTFIDRIVNDDAAIGLLYGEMKRNPYIQKLLASETPESISEWGLKASFHRGIMAEIYGRILDKGGNDEGKRTPESKISSAYVPTDNAAEAMLGLYFLRAKEVVGQAVDTGTDQDGRDTRKGFEKRYRPREITLPAHLAKAG